jgi:pilus assembly protein CpaF
MSWELILPFLRPIEHLILDPDISEIMVNPDGRVFTERMGLVQQEPKASLSQSTLEAAVKSIARQLGDDVSDEKPLLDARLPDGSRVAAVMPPCSLGGITFTIRKFNARRFTVADLVERATLTPELAESLELAIGARRNLLISGGTGTGKTTLLNILADFIPDEDRIVVIEDTAEIHIRKSNLVRFEARREQPGLPAVPIRELLKASLRHRPDRIIVGEIRGGEAFDLLNALNTGHSGSLSTVHANTARGALSRFENLTLQSGVSLPHKAIKANIADSLDLLVHINRRQGQRFVSEVLEIRRYLPESDEYELAPLFSHETVVAS